MRLQCNIKAMMMIRALSGKEGSAVRRRVEGLSKNPFPEDARRIAEKPGVYEIFEAGYWIAFEVDKSDPGETVVTILLIEPN